MRVYMLEYYEETEDDEYITEHYNLIGLYNSEEDAQNAKKRVSIKMNIDEELLYISSTKTGSLQWEGGFVSV